MRIFLSTGIKYYYKHSGAPIQEQGLGIRVLASFLESKGHVCDYIIPSAWPTTRVELLDGSGFLDPSECFTKVAIGTQTTTGVKLSIPTEEILERTKQFKPDILGVSIPVLAQLEGAIELAAIWKSDPELCDLPILLGGSALKGVPYWIEQDRFKNFAAFVHGEAEDALLNICNGVPLNQIDGVYTREKHDHIASTTKKSFLEVNKQPMVSNLDDLPYPDTRYDDEIRIASHKFNWLQEAWLWKTKWMQQHVHSLEGSRGCKFKCTFCETPGVKFRTHSPEYIDGLIDYYKKGFGAECIRFTDDSSASNLPWFKEVLKVLKKHQVEWFSMLRCDDLDEESIEIMSETKTKLIRVGLESGSEQVRRSMQKGLNIHKFYNNMELLAKKKIPTQMLMMVGWPTEDIVDLKETARAVKDVIQMGHDVSWGILVPMPGTRVYNQLKEQGNILVDERELDGKYFSTGFYTRGEKDMGPIWRHPLFSHDQIRKHQADLIDWTIACRRIYQSRDY